MIDATTTAAMFCKTSYAHSPTELHSAAEVMLVSEHRRALEQQFHRILSEHGAAISRLVFTIAA